MRIDPLYHWAPSERREAIRAEGLKLHSKPVVHNGIETAPYLCFGTSPQEAWLLSGDMAWVTEIEEWDLWQVWLGDRDEVHIRPQWGARIEEVKLYTPVPPDRLWFVGMREPKVFLPSAQDVS